MQEIDPNPDVSDVAGGEGDAGSFLSEIASSIPGIDEAMSFAEVMKQVGLSFLGCQLPLQAAQLQPAAAGQSPALSVKMHMLAAAQTRQK